MVADPLEINGTLAAIRRLSRRVILAPEERKTILDRAAEALKFHRGKTNPSGFIRLASRGIRPASRNDRDLHEIWQRIQIMVARNLGLLKLARADQFAGMGFGRQCACPAFYFIRRPIEKRMLRKSQCLGTVRPIRAGTGRTRRRRRAFLAHQIRVVGTGRSAGSSGARRLAGSSTRIAARKLFAQRGAPLRSEYPVRRQSGRTLETARIGSASRRPGFRRSGQAAAAEPGLHLEMPAFAGRSLRRDRGRFPETDRSGRTLPSVIVMRF